MAGRPGRLVEWPIVAAIVLVLAATLAPAFLRGWKTGAAATLGLGVFIAVLALLRRR